MKILVVEDDKKLGGFLRKGLAAQGWVVDFCDNGDEGFTLATTRSYDAMVLDIMLPGRDGLSILRNLRERRSNVPVILCTARSALNERLDGLNTGADDYLVKPFDNAELFARLRAVIRRSTRQTRSLLVIGEVQLDTAARTVTRAGQPVTLTAREYIVLEYLALHRGEVVTRTNLYEHLFDENDDTLSNVLDVHIFNLRKKLGQEFILTRRGHGYSIA